MELRALALNLLREQGLWQPLFKGPEVLRFEDSWIILIFYVKRPGDLAWGTEKQIQDRIEAHLKAGAKQVCNQPLHPDSDAHPDLKAVVAFARLNKPLRIDQRASTSKAS